MSSVLDEFFDRVDFNALPTIEVDDLPKVASFVSIYPGRVVVAQNRARQTEYKGVNATFIASVLKTGAWHPKSGRNGSTQYWHNAT